MQETVMKKTNKHTSRWTFPLWDKLSRKVLEATQTWGQGFACLRSEDRIKTKDDEKFPRRFTFPCKTCFKEEQNLTPYWICFFYFNLCFQLLLFAKRFLSTYIMVCLGEPCPSAWIFVQNPVYLWIATGKEEINTSALPHKAGHSRRYLQD